MELMGHQSHALPVVIMGAGPAGCAAAIALEQLGVACLVLERRAVCDVSPSDEPRESLHAGVEVLLRALGAENAWTLAATGTYSGILRQGFIAHMAPEGEGVWHGVHVRRSLFDHCLRSRVVAGGTCIRYESRVHDLIREGDRVSGIRLISGELVRACFVIDATGRQRLGARRIGARRQFASEPLVARSGRVSYVKATINSASFESDADGWRWLAVDADGSATWTRVTSHARELLDSDQRFVRSASSWRAFGVRWTLNRPLVSNGILLAGDAASVLDPASGQGVFKALNDGLLAASTVAQIVQGGAAENFHLALYDQLLVAAFEECSARLAAAYREQHVPFRIGLGGPSRKSEPEESATVP
jgi:flavin-dependent dehydrogenase